MLVLLWVKRYGNKNNTSDTFLVFKGREYRQININDIVCIKTSGKYSTIFMVIVLLCVVH